jgi:hypothetical protein
MTSGSRGDRGGREVVVVVEEEEAAANSLVAGPDSCLMATLLYCSIDNVKTLNARTKKQIMDRTRAKTRI